MPSDDLAGWIDLWFEPCSTLRVCVAASLSLVPFEFCGEASVPFGERRLN
jgi:hypothetical protein